MSTQSNKPEPTSTELQSLSPSRKQLMGQQTDRVSEWESRTGKELSAAWIVLGLHQKPLTQENLLRAAGLEGYEPDDLAGDRSLLEELDLPEWFGELPRELV
jgi:hypothetical protein